MSERQERDVRRTEAFSDVVIGFSLAQVGLSLVVPQRVEDLVNHPGWFVAFLWTFALVCLLWWNHHRLFRTVFVPTRVTIILNFVLLATIVLLTFLAEVLNRPAPLHDAALAVRLYYGALAANFLVWGLLAFVCSRDPLHGENPDLVRSAERAALVTALAGVVILILEAIGAWWLGDAFSIVGISASIPLAFILAGFAARAFGYRHVRPL